MLPCQGTLANPYTCTSSPGRIYLNGRSAFVNVVQNETAIVTSFTCLLLNRLSLISIIRSQNLTDR